jgi:hypothetical protein
MKLLLLIGALLLFLMAEGGQPRAAAPDPHCPGKDKPAVMCRLVNE